MAERIKADVTAAALLEIDTELTRLSGQAHGAASAVDREFAWLRMDALLDRRFKVSARRTNADEGAPTGSPADGSEHRDYGDETGT